MLINKERIFIFCAKNRFPSEAGFFKWSFLHSIDRLSLRHRVQDCMIISVVVSVMSDGIKLGGESKWRRK